MKFGRWMIGTLALLATACGTVQPTVKQPPVQEQPQAAEIQFELDTRTKTLRVVGQHNASGEFGKQVYYNPTTGYTIAGVITEQVGTVFNIRYTIRNTSTQGMGADGDVTVFMPSFTAKAADDTVVPGGGIVNADGYLPETQFPFRSFSNYIKPGDGVVFDVAIQVPEPAVKAAFGFGVQAGQDFNDAPIMASTYLQPAYGKFLQYGYKEGAADQARFSAPFSLTTCPSGKIYMSDSNGLWRLDAHHAKLVSSDEVYRTNVFIDCNTDEELIISSQSANKIYKTGSFWFSPTVIAGTTYGQGDGLGDAIKYANPRQVVTQGSDVFIADMGNRSVRKLSKRTDGSYLSATLVTMPESEQYVDGIAIDPFGNLYFGTYNGIWRRKAAGGPPVKIVSKPAGYQPLTIKWHPSGVILVAEFNEHRIRAYTPSATNPDLAWNPINIAGTGVEAGSYSRGEASKVPLKYPLGLTVSKHGTLFFSQFTGQNVVRIDRVR